MGGIILLLLLAYDLFKSVIRSSGSPLVKIIQSVIDTLSFMLFKLTNRRIVLIWTGSWIIVTLFFVWIVLLYIGWLCIFHGDHHAILRQIDQSPASFEERIYFTGFTISTLGIGDYIPNETLWQFLTTIASLSGFSLITFVVSFIISITQKQEARKQMALHIHYLGETPQVILKQMWDEEKQMFTGEALNNILPLLIQVQQQQQDQPLLNSFHGSSELRSLELALAKLDEALSMALFATQLDTFPPQFIQARRVLSDYIADFDMPINFDEHVSPPLPEHRELESLGLPLKSTVKVLSAYAELDQRRIILNSLLHRAGWQWSTTFMK